MSTYSVDEIMVNILDRAKPNDYPDYKCIGLEHLNSDTFEISPINDDVEVNSDKLLAKKGDVLFAKRRAYQRKVGIAPFDALLSTDGMVLRPNNSVIDGGLLPFFVRSDAFMDCAIRLSEGSMSPRVSWSTLRRQVFNIPELNEQKQLSELLWALECYSTLLAKRIDLLNLLVKSRFIEMFGDPIQNPKGWDKKKLRDLLIIERGGSPRPIDEYITEDPNGLNWIKIGDAQEGSYFIDSVKEKIKPEGLKKTREVVPGDLILSNSMSFGKPYILKISGCIHDGWLVLRDSENRFNKLFLCMALGFPSVTHSFKGSARGAVVNNLNKDLVGALDFIVPPIELQNEFVEFVEQVDKSKYVTCMAKCWN